MNVKEKIKLVKLFSGDMIIGSVEEPDGGAPMMDFNVNLNNPRQVAIMPTMTGTMRVGLGTVCEPFKVKRLRDFISIPKSQVMFTLDESEIDSQLVNGYKSEVSGIAFASASDTAALNGSSAPDAFLNK